MGATALGLITRDDDSAYRLMLSSVAGAAALDAEGRASAAALDAAGRAKVLAHLRRAGWRPTKGGSKPAATSGQASAVADQVGMIRALWARLAEAGVVQNHTQAGLRAWLVSQTRKYHPARSGYSAPEFLPPAVAQRVIEQLKGWAKRCQVPL